MGRKITTDYKHAGKRKNVTLHNNADLDKALQQNLSKLYVIFIIINITIEKR